jgi:hypothetical protein
MEHTMSDRLSAIVIEYHPADLEAWKCGEKKKWLKDSTVPPEVYNQPRYHFGEYFVLTCFEKALWKGYCWYALGNYEPDNPKLLEGRKKVRELLPADKLAAFQAARSSSKYSEGKGEPVGGEFAVLRNPQAPCNLARTGGDSTVRTVREILILAIHLLVTIAKILRPGGVRAVGAESLLLKHQLVISNRCRQRAPSLTSVDRFVLGLATLFVRPHRLPKLGAPVRPATLLKFHAALVEAKYRRLFSPSPSPRRRPGPKGPSAELIAAIIALKGRIPHFGCVRIAQQITRVFGVEIDKNSFGARSPNTTGRATPAPSGRPG